MAGIERKASTMSMISVTDQERDSSVGDQTGSKRPTSDSGRKTSQSHDQGYSGYHSDDGSDGDAMNHGLRAVLEQTTEKLIAWSEEYSPQYATSQLKELFKGLYVKLEEFDSKLKDDVHQLKQFHQNVQQESERLNSKLQQHSSEPDEHVQSVQEKAEVEARLAAIKLSLSQSEEDLLKANHRTLQFQQVLTQAELASVEAKEEAERLQRIAEQAAEEERLLKERIAREKLKEQLKREKEEALEAERRRLEELKLKMTAEQKAAYAAEWEGFQPIILKKEAQGFDQGVGCVLRFSSSVNLDAFNCHSQKQLDTTFKLDEHDELISNIIKLECTEDGVVFPLTKPVYLAIPHCLTRTSAISREPVIKRMNTSGEWADLDTTEVVLDSHKDLKLSQAVIYEPCTVAVVSRHKRDYLTIHKRGGKIQANVDSRVILTVERGTFSTLNRVRLQIQPVDTSTVQEVKRLHHVECFGLFASSPVMNFDWNTTDEEFKYPIQITLPCPPNPAKARKAADARAAKERKMNNQLSGYEAYLEEEAKRKDEERRRVITMESKNVRKWYMGTYGPEDDDENDNLFLYACDKKGKWHHVQYAPVGTTRLDLVTVKLHEPLRRFLVLRLKTTVEAWQGVKMTSLIDSNLNKRSVKVIMKQQLRDPTQTVLQIVQTSKAEKVLISLEDDGFLTGPDMSKELSLLEGQKIAVDFRGNITSKEKADMQFIFNSQLPSGLEFDIVEKSAFQAYYRGFVQIHAVSKETVKPPKTDEGVQPPSFDVEKRSLLTEMHLTIPKSYQQTPMIQPVSRRAPVVIINTKDVITIELLRHFAAQLGDEWKKLAQYLNIKRVRLQAIMRSVENNPEATDKDIDARHDMLLTWVKRVPKYVDKVAVLCSGFVRCGRADLSEELKEMEFEFKKRSAKFH